MGGGGSFLGTSKEERGSCYRLYFKDLLTPIILAQNVLNDFVFWLQENVKIYPYALKTPYDAFLRIKKNVLHSLESNYWWGGGFS